MLDPYSISNALTYCDSAYYLLSLEIKLFSSSVNLISRFTTQVGTLNDLHIIKEISMPLLISISPIVLVILGVVALNKPAKNVSLAVAIYTVLLGIFYFNATTPEVMEQTKIGIIEGAKMVYMIWAAFTVLQMLIHTGAMDKIKDVIADFTIDRRKQVVIIAFCFVGFLEGVAGAGTPAAIAAPFLVALGFGALEAASAALIFDGIAASLGAAGLTTIGGFSPFLENPGPEAVSTILTGVIPFVEGTTNSAIQVQDTITNLAMVTGALHFFGALIAPVLVIGILFGRKALDREFTIFGLIVGFTYGLTLIVVATFVGAEFPTILAGLTSFIVSVLYIHFFNRDFTPPVEYQFVPKTEFSNNQLTAVQSLATYMILLILLPLVRFFAPPVVFKYGFAIWIGTTIFVVAFLGSLVLKSTRYLPKYILESLQNVIPALVAMSALLVMANLMKTTGMLSTIAKFLASIAGVVYPALAVMIGSLGSFITGTTTGSNIMFAPMHFEAATILGITAPVLWAAQNAGGALGNMICTNNVVAVCATVDMKNQEGQVMRQVFKPIVTFWILYGGLALLYAYVIWPNLPIILQ